MEVSRSDAARVHASWRTATTGAKIAADANDMVYLTPHYDPSLVLVSVLIASLASYVALDLAKRVRAADRSVALTWWGGGSIAMGTGIWSMHFVGMLAFSVPIALGYTHLLTFISWAAAVAVSIVALGLASRGSLTVTRLADPERDEEGKKLELTRLPQRARHRKEQLDGEF